MNRKNLSTEIDFLHSRCILRHHKIALLNITDQSKWKDMDTGAGKI